MDWVKPVFLAILAGLVLTDDCNNSARTYMGSPVPDDVKGCNTSLVDVYQTDSKCFKPYGGEVNDVNGPSETCVCEEDQLCIANKMSNVNAAAAAAAAAAVAAGNSTANSNNTISANTDSSNNSTASAPAPPAAATLEQANSYEYKCMNSTASAALKAARLNVGGNAGGSSEGS